MDDKLNQFYLSIVYMILYCFLMARKAIPMIAFHLFLVSLMQVCVVYVHVVKEVASFRGAQSINGRGT